MSTLLFLSDDISLYLITYYDSINIFKAITSPHYYLIGNVISKMLLLVLANILTRLSKKKIGKPMPISYWVMVIFTPVSSTYLIHFVYSLSLDSSIHHILFTAIILAFNVFTFWLYDNLTNYYEVKTDNLRISLEKEHLENQILAYAYQHQLEIRKDESARYLKHNLTNLLSGIRTSVLSGNATDALERINKMIGDMNTYGPAKSSNVIIDSLINFKARTLSQQNICLNLSLNLPYNLELNAIDLSVIIGSIFDNAIEACCQLEMDRKINLCIQYDRGTLLIIMSNTFDGFLIKSNDGKLITRKENKKLHGMGIKAVQKIVDKYDGTMMYEARDHIFHLKIMLCNIQKENTGETKSMLTYENVAL